MDIITSQLGYLPLQHHDADYDEHFRILLKGFRVPSLGDAEPYYVDSLTEGPVTGWFLADAVDFEKEPRQWRMASPATSEGPAKWAPRAEAWDSHRDGLALLPAGDPLGLSYPGGYPAIVVAGHSIDKEGLLSSPSWAGLVAPSQDGILKLSSAVWDVAGGDLDQPAYAPIVSAWHLYRRPAGALYGAADRGAYRSIAWQMGMGFGPADAANTVAGLGMVYESGFGRSVFAAASAQAGGPWDVAYQGDQHRIGVEPATGEQINALHTSTQQIYIRPDGSADSGQQDGGGYVPCKAGPLLTEAYWRHDAEAFHTWRFGVGAGLWRWQSSSFIATIPEPPEDGFPPLPPKAPQAPKPGGPGSSQPGTQPKDGASPGGATTPQPLAPFTPGRGQPFDPLKPFPPPPAGIPFGPEVGESPRGPALVLAASPTAIEPRPLASAFGEIGVRGLVFRENANWRAYGFGQPAIDYRSEQTQASSDGLREWAGAAAVIRMDIAADPDTAGASRYRNVAAGTVWLLPAEVGLEDTYEAAKMGVSSPSVDYTTKGKRWFGLSRGVGLFFGAPANDKPWAPGQGMAMEFVPSGTFFKMTTYSSSGAGTDILTLLSGGALSVVQSVSAPALIGSTSVSSPTHIVTGSGKRLDLVQGDGASWSTDRTQYFQDRDGVVALTAMKTSVHGANFTAVADTIHGVKSSGGAYTATLPTAASCAGQKITIADLEGDALPNTITINVASGSGDLIQGASSTTIEDHYGAVCLMAIVDGSQGYWIRC